MKMALSLALLVMQQLMRAPADAVTNLFGEISSQPWDNWVYGHISHGIDPQHTPTCGWKVILSSSHPLCYVQSWDVTKERLNNYTFILTSLAPLAKPLNHDGTLALHGPFGNIWPSIIANYFCVCNASTSGNCQNVAHETAKPTGSTLSNMSCPGVEVFTTPWSPATSLLPSPATGVSTSPATRLLPLSETGVSPSPATSLLPLPETGVSTSPATRLLPLPETGVSTSPATRLLPFPSTGVSTSPTITLPSTMPNSKTSTAISPTPTLSLLASTVPPSQTTPPSTSTLASLSTYLTLQASLMTSSSTTTPPTPTFPASTTLSGPLPSSLAVSTAPTKPTRLTSPSTLKTTTKASQTSTSSTSGENSNSKCLSNLHMARLENTCYTGAIHTTLPHIHHFVDCCSICCSYPLCQSVNFRPLTGQCDIILESTNGASSSTQSILGCQYWVVEHRS